MCKVSTDIKFCSCATITIGEGKHYWVFYRCGGENVDIVLGEAMLPVGIDILTDYYNRELLRYRINEKKSFDKELPATKKDRLLIALYCPGASSPLFYGFEFDGREWQEKDFDPFEWRHHHQQIEKGKVENGVL